MIAMFAKNCKALLETVNMGPGGTWSKIPIPGYN
jgi:hypothetical protein